jgi:hypothetical protein
MFGLAPEHVCTVTVYKLRGLATWDEGFRDLLMNNIVVSSFIWNMVYASRKAR